MTEVEQLRRSVSVDDERYRHQIVAPQLVTVHPQANWAERCYLTLHAGPDLMVNMGRAVYPYAGRRASFATVRRGPILHAMRQIEPFVIGDDPDRPDVGALRIEVVRPLEELHLVLDAPDGPLSYDLTFTARSPGIPTRRNLIETQGELVTDYMNFFQSGWYTGTIVLNGEPIDLGRRAGFRDRGWGIRKHEGAPRRGLVLFGALEFPDQTLHVLLYETASGRRAFTDGWLVDGSGVTDTLVGAEHDLEQEDTLLSRGTMQLQFASGATRELRFVIETGLFLAAGGYAADVDALPAGYAHYDVADPAVLARLDGQNDMGGRFFLDGVEGYGLIETGFGSHPRYRSSLSSGD
jgi:hypothetical protein